MESNLLKAHTSMSIGRDIRADDLEGRLVQFAIDIVKLVGELPQNFQARHGVTWVWPHRVEGSRVAGF